MRVRFGRRGLAKCVALRQTPGFSGAALLLLDLGEQKA
jgi:hypothetical protein